MLIYKRPNLTKEFKMANFNYDAFSSAASDSAVRYDAGLRSFFLKTYNLMALGVAFTGLITLFMASEPQIMQTIAIGPAKWVVFIALLGLGWFAPKLIFTKSVGLAHGAFWLYAGLMGVLISPMIAFFLNVPGGVMDIARAFFITSGMFAGASLYGMVTKKNLAGLGRFFMMAIIGVLIMSVVNMFVASTAFTTIISLVTILLFAGMTAYETQMLKAQYDQFSRGGDEQVGRLAIFGAFTLYGSFMTMFINILQLLAIMRSNN